MTVEANRLSSFGNASRCAHSHPALSREMADERRRQSGPRMNFNSYSSRPFRF